MRPEMVELAGSKTLPAAIMVTNKGVAKTHMGIKRRASSMSKF